MRIFVTPNMPPLRWGYMAITLWPIGIFFADEDYILDEDLVQHEIIHWEQQKEMLGILFYVWYGIEYIVRLIQKRDHWKAYAAISFEQEANYGERLIDYLEDRLRFSWWIFFL